MKQGPIVEVGEGMPVCDATGEVIGKVERVRMGDPEADTEIGQDAGDPVKPFPGIAAGLEQREPDLPAPEAARLARVGFVEIDSSGLFSRNRYVGADEIDRVMDGTVHLTATKDRLTKKRGGVS